MSDDELEIITPDMLVEVPDDDPRDIRAMGFHNLTREERQEMAKRSVATRRANKRAAKLAELEAYTDAHRELASQILGTKMFLLDGLVDEMKGSDGNLDTSRLDEKRMKLLMQLMKQLEERAFGGIVTKHETKATVDIRAAIVDLTKSLSKPDTV